MALKYNGSNVTAVTYNGQTVTKVIYNGTVIWPTTAGHTVWEGDNVGDAFTASGINPWPIDGGHTLPAGTTKVRITGEVGYIDGDSMEFVVMDGPGTIEISTSGSTWHDVASGTYSGGRYDATCQAQFFGGNKVYAQLDYSWDYGYYIPYAAISKIEACY